MGEVNYDDYSKILKFYKMNVPRSKRMAKKNAENILAKKLCGCMNAITRIRRTTRKGKKTTYKRKEAVAICRNKVLESKGVINYGFTCKKTPKLNKGKKGITLRKLTRKRREK